MADPPSADATSPRPPRGRAEVTEAILAAATELIAARGPAAVSIRDIAARAGVNHGLVHRHFGSKAALVLAVHNRLAERLAADLDLDRVDPEAARRAHEALASNETYWRVLARSALDGELSEVLASRLPLGHDLVSQLARVVGPDGPPAAELVAMNLAFSLGWIVFEDFVRAATGAAGDVPGEWFALQSAALAAGRRATGGGPPGPAPRREPRSRAGRKGDGGGGQRAGGRGR